MKLHIKRYKGKDYSIGKLYIDDVYFCDTLEDPDRGLDQNMDISKIMSMKIKGNTAIPTGTYDIDMNRISPKYSISNQYIKLDSQYKLDLKGRLPYLKKVPGFEGILIHIGNWPKDTEGCILVGYNKIKGMVSDSTNTFVKLYKKLREASDRFESIKIKIE